VVRSINETPLIRETHTLASRLCAVVVVLSLLTPEEFENDA
jgi:hypothetical protein